MPEKTYVIGVGMTKFEKPGSKEWDYPDMGREAGEKALADAGVPYEEVESAFLAYCYGDSTSGQRALYELGLTGIPAVNVNNNCSTGSSALYLARKFIQGGLADCVLALGFEKMQKGSLKGNFDDRTNPMDKHVMDMIERRGFEPAPPAAQVFGNAGREYMERYGVTAEAFAKIGEKNHRHSVNNPYSQFRDEYSLEDRAVEIAGQSMTTDFANTFSGSDMAVAGYHMTEAAAREAYEEAGVGPEDAQVVELHDCFSANELITYQGLGLCAEGKAGDLIHDGAVTYGGQWVVNPSGGLISKGHPLGATGLAQCSELTWQLRGEAEARQVEGAKVGIQHNLGLGGAAVVTVYKKDPVPA